MLSDQDIINGLHKFGLMDLSMYLELSKRTSLDMENATALTIPKEFSEELKPLEDMYTSSVKRYNEAAEAKMKAVKDVQQMHMEEHKEDYERVTKLREEIANLMNECTSLELRLARELDEDIKDVDASFNVESLSEDISKSSDAFISKLRKLMDISDENTSVGYNVDLGIVMCSPKRPMRVVFEEIASKVYNGEGMQIVMRAFDAIVDGKSEVEIKSIINAGFGLADDNAAQEQ